MSRVLRWKGARPPLAASSIRLTEAGWLTVAYSGSRPRAAANRTV